MSPPIEPVVSNAKTISTRGFTVGTSPDGGEYDDGATVERADVAGETTRASNRAARVRRIGFSGSGCPEKRATGAQDLARTRLDLRETALGDRRRPRRHHPPPTRFSEDQERRHRRRATENKSRAGAVSSTGQNAEPTPRKKFSG
jgi:hypothetical protein